jgi:hypothetical protein
MLGAKRSHSHAMGTKYNSVDLLGAKMVVHDDKKPKAASQDKAAKLEKKK